MSDGATLTAIFAVSAATCDGNLAALSVLDRAELTSRVSLAGIVLVDGDSAAPRLRRQMFAYDVAAPVLRLSRATSESLGTLVKRHGPVLALFDRDRRLKLVLTAPQSSRELMELTATLAAIAPNATR